MMMSRPIIQQPVTKLLRPSFHYSAPSKALNSSLIFSNHISNLTPCSYFHLRRLRDIRKSVSILVFTFLAHAFVCSQIDHCNSLLIVLPQIQLSTCRGQ